MLPVTLRIGDRKTIHSRIQSIPYPHENNVRQSWPDKAIRRKMSHTRWAYLLGGFPTLHLRIKCAQDRLASKQSTRNQKYCTYSGLKSILLVPASTGSILIPAFTPGPRNAYGYAASRLCSSHTSTPTLPKCLLDSLSVDYTYDASHARYRRHVPAHNDRTGRPHMLQQGIRTLAYLGWIILV